METNSNHNDAQKTEVENLNNNTNINYETNNNIDFTNTYSNILNNINSIRKVAYFDNTNEFEYYSKHMDDLIDLHQELKNDNTYLGIMNTSRPFKFVTIIMRNLYFQQY